MIPSCCIVGMTNPVSGGGGGGGGGGSPTISLTNQGVSDAKNSGTAFAAYHIGSNGTVTADSIAGLGVFVENWISDPAQAGSYEVKAELSSGTAPTGTLATYQALSSTRSWSLSNALHDNSTKSCVLTVSIRKTGTTTVLATATITISAESDTSG